MRIAIDATPIVASRKGIGSVAEGLVSACDPESELGRALIFVDRTFENEARRQWPGRSIVPVDIRSSLVWETIQLRRLLARNRIDVLVTLRERTLVPAGTKTLVWLFEVPDHRVKLLLGSDAGAYERLVARHSVGRFARVARKTTHFVVSSDFTRHDLIAKYKVPGDRITKIYPGIAPAFVHYAADHGKWIKRNPYVLHFATGDLRENSANAIDAFARACRRFAPDVALVLAGVPELDRARIATLVERLGISARTEVRGYIAASEMPALFAGADIYLDPTLVEGFGLQLVEAMAVGTCVVASDRSSVPEIVGDAGILVAPDDVSSMSDALATLLGDAEQRHELIERGTARSAKFSWASSAAALNDLVVTI